MKAIHDVTITTWAKTHSAQPSEYYEPSTVTEIQDIVRASNKNGKVVRVVGSAHSPNDCAMTHDVMISLKKFNKVLMIDVENTLIKVQAGITLAELNEALANVGLALPSLGSISEQSIAGAISTGTHGSSAQFGAISSCVAELQLVLADGSIKVCNKDVDADLFHAALCSFGCIGMITGLILKVVPSFDLQAVENASTLSEVLRDLNSRIHSAPYYRFWWFPHTDKVLEWRAFPRPTQKVDVVESGVKARLVNWFWSTLVGFHLYQLLLWIALFIPRIIPWINAAWFCIFFSSPKTKTGRSDRIFNFDCLFEQHVDEWAIPADSLPQAMNALKDLLDDKDYRVHFPVEVRFVAADDAWLSPSSGRFTCYIGIIMYKPFGFEVPYKNYFDHFEKIMLRHEGRPHWAKDFHLRGDADFTKLYPKWVAFKELRAKYDSKMTFANSFVKRTLGLSILSSQPIPDERISANLASLEPVLATSIGKDGMLQSSPTALQSFEGVVTKMATAELVST